ncbi:cystine ABC tranporter, permease protein [Phenylobacterium zucineum HLK1]|uniref:Cystine ABC tranporter, permease protein n=1 Tax=Phenylobacterium zucineum (strain HLK1) TaxID=450851 RepID=B4RDL8_PHEZH|nr:amino acid ABC transporter permease [Phenylobacterium zucineum]ACG78408.1 cystine ABC tranporter, permease protein [Phenylobacterium zucineum HLK1]
MGDFLSQAISFLPILGRGMGVTVLISLGALALSLLLGLGWALLGQSRFAALRGISRTSVVVLRGIPIIVQLFYVYFVLPEFGLSLDAMWAGIIGLGVAYSVYQAENFRAGIQSVDPALVEAARSLGMSEGMIMRRVILPLAIRTALPPFGNTSIMLLKDSSIASTITVAELTRAGQLLAISTFQNMTVYTLIALLYLAMSLPLTFLVHRLEKRMARR